MKGAPFAATHEPANGTSRTSQDVRLKSAKGVKALGRLIRLSQDG